jgi:hypothetical protein
VPATAISAAAPIPELDSPPRVLIRLPAIPTALPKPATKPAATILAGLPAAPSTTPIAVDLPWYAQLHTTVRARLNTPRVKKYLPYTMAVVIAFGGFLWMRSHSGKSHPVAADPEPPAWNSSAALPHSQAINPTQPGAGNGPNWGGPALPSSNGLPSGTPPNAAGGSPSAYQPPPNPAPMSNYQPGNYQPSTASSGYQSAAAPSGAQNDSVPPMPARNPAWGNQPGNPPGDPNVVQNAPAAPEYRTAQANDPAVIPPGRSPNDANQPGVAQFQGGITRPQ